MRYIYSCSIAILLLFFLFTNGMEVKAVKSGLITDHLSEEERKTFLSNVDFSLLEEEPTKKAIECFDISNSGMIAIGQKGSDNKVVCIYSQDGTFVYGYTFPCSGAYAVECVENELNIFLFAVTLLQQLIRMGKYWMLGKYKIQLKIIHI